MTHEELLQQRRTLGDVLNELRRIGRIQPDSEAIIIIAETQLMLLDHLLEQTRESYRNREIARRNATIQAPLVQKTQTE